MGSGRLRGKHGAPHPDRRPRASGDPQSGGPQLSILFDDQRYVTCSELEIERGYADLCLLVRPETRWPRAFDLLFEFKLVRRKRLGKSGRELRDLDEAALRRLPVVEKAFDEARGQAEEYRRALSKQRGGGLNLRSYVVVAVGLERILGEEVAP